MVLRNKFDKGTDRLVRQFMVSGQREWANVPVDAFGLPTVEWLKSHGARIVRSELKTEKHQFLGKAATYQQGFRIDSHEVGADVPFFAASNETRGSGETGFQVCWPIDQRA